MLRSIIRKLPPIMRLRPYSFRFVAACRVWWNVAGQEMRFAFVDMAKARAHTPRGDRVVVARTPTQATPSRHARPQMSIGLLTLPIAS